MEDDGSSSAMPNRGGTKGLSSHTVNATVATNLSQVYQESKELLLDCEEIESTKSFEIQHCDVQSFLDSTAVAADNGGCVKSDSSHVSASNTTTCWMEQLKQKQPRIPLPRSDDSRRQPRPSVQPFTQTQQYHHHHTITRQHSATSFTKTLQHSLHDKVDNDDTKQKNSSSSNHDTISLSSEMPSNVNQSETELKSYVSSTTMAPANIQPKTVNSIQKTVSATATATATATAYSSLRPPSPSKVKDAQVLNYTSSSSAESELYRLRKTNTDQAETIQRLLEEKRELLLLVKKLQEQNSRQNEIISRVRCSRESGGDHNNYNPLQRETRGILSRSPELSNNSYRHNTSLIDKLIGSSEKMMKHSVSGRLMKAEQAQQILLSNRSLGSQNSGRQINTATVAAVAPAVSSQTNRPPLIAVDPSPQCLVNESEKTKPTILTSLTFASPNERDFWSNDHASASTCVSVLSPIPLHRSSSGRREKPTVNSGESCEGKSNDHNRSCRRDIPAEELLFLSQLTKDEGVRLSMSVKSKLLNKPEKPRIPLSKVQSQQQQSLHNRTASPLAQSFDQEANNKSQVNSFGCAGTAAFQTLISTKPALSNLPSKVHENFHKLLSRSYTKPTAQQHHPSAFGGQNSSSQSYSSSSTSFQQEFLFKQHQQRIPPANTPMVFEEVSPRTHLSQARIHQFFTKTFMNNAAHSGKAVLEDLTSSASETILKNSSARSSAHQHSYQVLHSFQQPPAVALAAGRQSNCSSETTLPQSSLSFSSRQQTLQHPCPARKLDKSDSISPPARNNLMNSSNCNVAASLTHLNNSSVEYQLMQQQQTVAQKPSVKYHDNIEQQQNQESETVIIQNAPPKSNSQPPQSVYSTYQSLLLPLPQSKKLPEKMQKVMMSRNANELQLKHLYNQVGGYFQNYVGSNDKSMTAANVSAQVTAATTSLTSFAPPPKSLNQQHFLKPSNVPRKDLSSTTTSAAVLQKLSSITASSSSQNSSRRTPATVKSAKSSNTMSYSCSENTIPSRKQITLTIGRRSENE